MAGSALSSNRVCVALPAARIAHGKRGARVLPACQPAQLPTHRPLVALHLCGNPWLGHLRFHGIHRGSPAGEGRQQQAGQAEHEAGSVAGRQRREQSAWQQTPSTAKQQRLAGWLAGRRSSSRAQQAQRGQQGRAGTAGTAGTAGPSQLLHFLQQPCGSPSPERAPLRFMRRPTSWNSMPRLTSG